MRLPSARAPRVSVLGFWDEGVQRFRVDGVKSVVEGFKVWGSGFQDMLPNMP